MTGVQTCALPISNQCARIGLVEQLAQQAPGPAAGGEEPGELDLGLAGTRRHRRSRSADPRLELGAQSFGNGTGQQSPHDGLAASEVRIPSLRADLPGFGRVVQAPTAQSHARV